jgi:hypothetical protein
MSEHDLEAPEDEFIQRLDHSIRILNHMIGKAGTVISSGKVSDSGKAAAEVLPGAANLALAMRELLRKRLLSPTEVLLRALLDRVGTLAYFRAKGEEGLKVWQKGWPFNDRPSFDQKLEFLPAEIYASKSSIDPKKRFSTEQLKLELKNLTKSMNSVVHGGPDSVDKTFVDRHGEFDFHVIGSDNVNTTYYGTLSSVTVVSIMLLVFEIQSAFGLDEEA